MRCLPRVFAFISAKIFTIVFIFFCFSKRQWLANQSTPQEVLTVYMMVGLTDLHIANLRNMSLNFTPPQKYPASNYLNQKNARIKYLNTDLFNQTDSSNA